MDVVCPFGLVFNQYPVVTTLIKSLGVDAKVVQELLRHSSLKVTTDVYASCQPAEKSGPKQTGQNGYGLGKSRGRKGFSITGPNWTMTKNRHFTQVLWNVGVPDGI
jgi:hypothetical protein